MNDEIKKGLDCMRKIFSYQILCLAIFFTPLIVSAGCLNDNDEVEFTGILKKELFYGPPRFGEDKVNDSKEYYWILSVDNPVSCIEGVDRSRDEWNKKFQLDLDERDLNVYGRIISDNAHIYVKGHIQQAEAPTDNTPVIITDISVVHTSTSGER